MGIVQRKERDKEEMRRRILDAALHLFREKGFDGVSIRNIAEAIEYSPGTIYLYFKDKNEIFYALQYEAATIKRNHLFSAALIENPWERVQAIGRLYIDFGLKHQDLYDLLFIMRAPMESLENQQCWILGQATHAFFVESVQECINQRYFKSTDAVTIAFTLWCHVHGLVSMFVRDRIRMYPEKKREQLIADSFSMIIKMAATL